MPVSKRGGKKHSYLALILCAGRMDRGDDAVGPLCAAALEERRIPARIVRGDTSELLEAWQSAQCIIVVDAIVTGRTPPGTLHRVTAEDAAFQPETARCSANGAGLAHAVKLGRVLKCLPATLVLIGLEAGSFDWAATLSPAVAAAMPALVEAVVQEWRRLTDVRPQSTRRSSAA